MALFKRKNSNLQVPAELEQYYERPAWQMWARRIVALVVVVLILFAVFMLARAVYRNVADDGDNATKGSSQSQSEEEKKKNTEANKDKDEEKNTQSQQNNSGTNGNSSTSQSQGSQTGQGSAIPKTGDDPTDQPPAGTAPSALPRTGDDPSDPLPPGYTQ